MLCIRCGVSVTGVLGDYQAYWDRGQRQDGLRAGEGKLADARINGVLPGNSYVCTQLMSAKASTINFASRDANSLVSEYPYTFNLGRGARLPNNAFGVHIIGNTRYFNRPF